MHTDRKIGFAMGILLIGIVAALFFRNEPLMNPELPTVRRERELNERLRERDVAVYLEDSSKPTASESKESRKPKSLRDALNQMGGRKQTRSESANKPEPVGKDESDDNESAVSPDDEIVPIPTQEAIDAEKRSVASDESGSNAADSEDLPAPVVSIPSEPLTDPVEPQTDAFVPPAEFEEYTVKYGDTLSGIAQRFLGSQSRYQEIYEANRDRMSSPDRLDVGKPLRIPKSASTRL